MTTSLTGTESNKTKGAIPNDERPRVYTRAGYMRGLDDPEPDYRGGNPPWFEVPFPAGIEGVIR